MTFATPVTGDLLEGGPGEDALVGDLGAVTPTLASALGAPTTLRTRGDFILEQVRTTGSLVRMVELVAITVGGDDGLRPGARQDVVMGQPDDVRLSFNEVAEIYGAVRPSYPADLFDALFEMLPSDPTIVEVGPGTGQATRDLLARGASVNAIEIGPSLAAKLGSNVRSDRLVITSRIAGSAALRVGAGGLVLRDGLEAHAVIDRLTHGTGLQHADGAAQFFAGDKRRREDLPPVRDPATGAVHRERRRSRSAHGWRCVVSRA